MFRLKILVLNNEVRRACITWCASWTVHWSGIEQSHVARLFHQEGKSMVKLCIGNGSILIGTDYNLILVN